MKKLLSFLLIFFSTFFFSQEYTFDYSVKINHKSLTTNDNEIDSFLFYYNNSNQNSLYNYNNGDLSLFDFDNKKKYVLKELKDKTIQFRCNIFIFFYVYFQIFVFHVIFTGKNHFFITVCRLIFPYINNLISSGRKKIR